MVAEELGAALDVAHCLAAGHGQREAGHVEDAEAARVVVSLGHHLGRARQAQRGRG